MSWTVTTQPAAEPITTAEAKIHLKVDGSTEDTLIDAYIATARQYVENYTSKKLVTQTVQQTYDSFPADCLELSVKPIQSVTSVAYIDTAGDSQTWSSADYDTDFISTPGRIAPGLEKEYPSLGDVINAVTITYVVGYGGAADVPERYKSAIKLIVGELYENRENRVKKMPTAAEALLMQDIDLT